MIHPRLVRGVSPHGKGVSHLTSHPLGSRIGSEVMVISRYFRKGTLARQRSLIEPGSTAKPCDVQATPLGALPRVAPFAGIPVVRNSGISSANIST
jgi:hypothetical protein